MTDLELQLWLAARLPERLQVFQTADKSVWWIYPYGTGPVKDTEWEHIVWLIERGLTPEQKTKYYWTLAAFLLGKEVPLNCTFVLINASWQQRARALTATLGETKGGR